MIDAYLCHAPLVLIAVYILLYPPHSFSCRYLSKRPMTRGHLVVRFLTHANIGLHVNVLRTSLLDIHNRRGLRVESGELS